MGSLLTGVAPVARRLPPEGGPACGAVGAHDSGYAVQSAKYHRKPSDCFSLAHRSWQGKGSHGVNFNEFAPTPPMLESFQTASSFVARQDPAGRVIPRIFFAVSYIKVFPRPAPIFACLTEKESHTATASAVLFARFLRLGIDNCIYLHFHFTTLIRFLKT